MQKYLFTLSIFFIFNGLSLGQDTQEAKMAFFADVLVNADEKSHRLKGHEAFLPLLEDALGDTTSFDKPFSSLKWISIQYPQDSSFRIFSWQLKLDEDHYRYFGYIQKKDGTVIKLEEGNDELIDLPYMLLYENEWIGCIYYKILQFDQGEERKYVSFGYNANNRFERIKYADILNINEDRISFGSPSFVNIDSTGREEAIYRIILQYSADSNVNLNYNPSLKMIIYDNLIPVLGRIEGQGPTLVSDGSYKGYKLNEEGKWIYVDKVFDHIYEEAPRPKPVFNKQEKKN